MALGSSITVINKSGKVVKNSKHIVNVFKEAQSAYRERKADIKATRKVALDESRARQGLDDLSLDDHDNSRSSSRRRNTREKPPVERGYSDSFYTNDLPESPRGTRPSPLRHENLLNVAGQRQELTRRNTDGMLRDHMSDRPETVRSASMDDIDMDLAYGELPPPLPPRRRDEAMELRNQVSKLQQMLDEANCLQHSVTSMIDSLQKNPDQLAAVALTLAEISNLASKMAPGALMALKGSFPAVIALVCAPEFLIAAGVGLGVTIIALGGYKIIKRIQRKKAEEANAEDPSDFDELQEINSDLSRIELWRRGIAENQAASIGTSVDGEFVTPTAGRQLISEGKLRENDLKSSKSKHRSHGKSKSKSKTKAESQSGSTKETVMKMIEPSASGIKMLFKNNVTHRGQKQLELEPEMA